MTLREWNRRADEIKRLHKEGMTYRQIGEKFNIRVRQAWAIGSGRAVKTRQTRQDMTIPPEYEQAKRYPYEAIGHIGEHEVIAELLKREFDVWRPVWAQHRCDAGISIGARFTRVQIKSATYDRNKFSFRVPLTHRQSRVRRSYGDGDFDFFLIRCLGANATYVIPATVGIKLKYVNLYPGRDRLLKRKEIDLNQYKDAFDLLK